MEENTSTTQTGLFHDNRLEALLKKPEEQVAGPSTSISEWLSLPAPQKTNETSLPAGSIPPGQKPPANPAAPVSWAIKKKSLQDYERYRVKKYAQYFQGDEILPIPEFVTEVEPYTLSFIITDLRTRRLAEFEKKRRLRSYWNPQAFHVGIFPAQFRHLGCPAALRRVSC